MIASRFVFLLVLGCAGGGDDDAVVDDVGDDDDDDIVAPGVANCISSTNPLVVECSVTLDAAADATLTLSAPGLPTRTFTSDAAATDHLIYGWGLRAETTYDWEFAGETGTVTTREIPGPLLDADITVSGTLFDADAALVYMSCGWFAMIDSDGEIIWAVPTEIYDAISDGMMWSQQDRSVLAISDSTMTPGGISGMEELHISGTSLMHLEPGTPFTLGLTHDVGRWGPYTYLLGKREDRMSGFEVWEGETPIGVYMLDDSFTGVPDLADGHVASLAVSSEGDVVLSAYGFDGILSVDGDPASPTFLQLQWHAWGEPGGGDDLPDPDYLPSDPGSGALFLKQHNASRYGDDLWVFDNQSKGDARALHMTMDHTGGRLVETESWSLGLECLNQGGALPLEGGVLATCANTGDVFAFRSGSSTPDWTMRAECAGGTASFVENGTRAFPVYVR